MWIATQKGIKLWTHVLSIQTSICGHWQARSCPLIESSSQHNVYHLAYSCIIQRGQIHHALPKVKLVTQLRAIIYVTSRSMKVGSRNQLREIQHSSHQIELPVNKNNKMNFRRIEIINERISNILDRWNCSSCWMQQQKSICFHEKFLGLFFDVWLSC